MKAIIFAAGLGRRLGKITEEIPKALVDINGKTVLRLAVEKCSSFGFTDIIINVHHFADLVEAEVAKLRESGFTITVSDERDALLETGGGLFKAREFFDKEPFLIYNVDIISDIDLKDFLKSHIKLNGLATLAVRNRPGNRVFLIDNTGRLSGWRNRQTGEEILTKTEPNKLSEVGFSGIHIADPRIFQYMTYGKYSLKDLYLELASVHNIFTYNDTSSNWIDIGTAENLEAARKMNE